MIRQVDIRQVDIRQVDIRQVDRAGCYMAGCSSSIIYIGIAAKEQLDRCIGLLLLSDPLNNISCDILSICDLDAIGDASVYLWLGGGGASVRLVCLVGRTYVLLHGGSPQRIINFDILSSFPWVLFGV